ncbi:MAG: hypothetical protein M0022_04770, partial [Desulfobacteraceae bacterium]|nr:hypothetical protein [Desulfobacteraceae bacterium]
RLCHLPYAGRSGIDLMSDTLRFPILEQLYHLCRCPNSSGQLSHLREGKEWFRCSASEAINKIRSVVGKQAIAENMTNNSDDIFSRTVPAPPPIDRHLQKSTSRAYSIAKLREEMERIRRGNEAK